ncbi:hypothetical protein N665_0223s0002 [Sinapis alba]|nr:hypothetical protein N665_0223s0002 [Sinapis alba]
MSSSTTNIYFDYEGNYSKNGYSYELIPSDVNPNRNRFFFCGSLRYIRIRQKRLNLSYIPLVVKHKRQSYILNDENMFLYLTSMDKDLRRSILHVEFITKLEVIPITEQISRTEKASS